MAKVPLSTPPKTMADLMPTSPPTLAEQLGVAPPPSEPVTLPPVDTTALRLRTLVAAVSQGGPERIKAQTWQILLRTVLRIGALKSLLRWKGGQGTATKVHEMAIHLVTDPTFQSSIIPQLDMVLGGKDEDWVEEKWVFLSFCSLAVLTAIVSCPGDER